MRNNGIERFADKISKDVEDINYGENIINNFSSQHVGNLKEMMETQKILFKNLNEKMNQMKEKIAEFDELNGKVVVLKEKIQQKADIIDGGNEIQKMQKALNSLNQDILDVDVRIGLIENRLFKFKCTTKLNNLI